MNFLDQLRTLDPRDVGRWPLPVRGFFVALIFTVVAAFAWYMFVWNDDRPLLQKAEADELDLRAQFASKQQRAANLDAYKAQLGEMERSFGAMLRQLPGKTEVPNLLVDISQTGLAAGLQEKLFQRRATAFTPSCRSGSSWSAPTMTSAISSAASPHCHASSRCTTFRSRRSMQRTATTI